MRTFVKRFAPLSFGLILAFIFLCALLSVLSVSPKAAFSESGLTPVKVVFSVPSDLVYDGRIKAVTASAHEDTPVSKNIFDIRYSRVPRDAGTVVATAVLLDDRYSIANKNTVEFTITKKTLTVKVNDLICAEGQNPTFTFTYTGFCEGDSVNDIQTLPTVAARSYSAGEYQVKPSGAVSKNYAFEYTAGKLIVTKPELISSDNNISISGAFIGDVNISKVDPPRAAGDLALLRFAAYCFEMTFDGETYGEKCHYLISSGSGVNYIPLLTRITITNAEGKHVITNLKKAENGDITFTSTAVGTITVYYDFLPIGIVVAVAVVLITAILLFRKKDKKRFNAVSAAEEYLDEKVRETRNNIRE